MFICNCQSNNSLNSQSLKSNPAKIYPFAFHSHAFRESIQHARYFRSNDRIEIECYKGPVDNRIYTPSDWSDILRKGAIRLGFLHCKYICLSFLSFEVFEGLSISFLRKGSLRSFGYKILMNSHARFCIY